MYDTKVAKQQKRAAKAASKKMERKDNNVAVV